MTVSVIGISIPIDIFLKINKFPGDQWSGNIPQRFPQALLISSEQLNKQPSGFRPTPYRTTHTPPHRHISEVMVVLNPAGRKALHFYSRMTILPMWDNFLINYD